MFESYHRNHNILMCLGIWINDILYLTNITYLSGSRHIARAWEYTAGKLAFLSSNECMGYRRQTCQQMILTKWDNCYQRYAQSAFRNTEEAITNIPVVGFSVGVQKALLSEGEVLHSGFFFF